VLLRYVKVFGVVQMVLLLTLVSHSIDAEELYIQQAVVLIEDAVQVRVWVKCDDLFLFL